MLSQNAILEDMSDVIPYIDFGNKTLGLLPLHHTYGSSVMIVGHAMIGCEVYISSGLRYIMKELKEQQPEHLVLVPLYIENFYRKILANAKDTGKEKTLFKMMKSVFFDLIDVFDANLPKGTKSNQNRKEMNAVSGMRYLNACPVSY